MSAAVDTAAVDSAIARKRTHHLPSPPNVYIREQSAALGTVRVGR